MVVTGFCNIIDRIYTYWRIQPVLRDPEPDPWFLRFEEAVKRQINWHHSAGDVGHCRPAGMIGISMCPRPVVRSGRCVLHAPKLTLEEKLQLSPSERKDEEAFEKQFIDELKKETGRAEEKRNICWDGYHFPTIQWNQPPWSQLFTNGGLYSGLMVFHQPTNFSGVRFGTRPLFHTAIFRDKVTFGAAHFDNGVIFEKAVFQKTVDLGAEYSSVCLFTHVSFLEEAEFNGATVKGEMSFFDVQFKGDARFDNARISGRLTFHGSDDTSVFFSNLSMCSTLVHPQSEVTFKHVSLESASFLRTNVEGFNFMDIQWLRTGARSIWRFNRRRMLRDECRLTDEDGTSDVHEAVADNYRQLVRACEGRRDYEAAEDFHVGEMEVHRLRRRLWFNKVVLRRLAGRCNAFSVYRTLSCYGCSYWQAVFVFCVFLIVFSAVFMLTGLIPTQAGVLLGLSPIKYQLSLHPEQWPHMAEVAKDFFWATQNTLLFVLLQRNRPFTAGGLVGQLLESASGVVLAGQIALVLLAIRRRFRR